MTIATTSLVSFLEIIGENMKIFLGLLFVIATATVAGWAPPGVAVPEINPAVVPAALELLGGGLLVVRAYFKK